MSISRHIICGVWKVVFTALVLVCCTRHICAQKDAQSVFKVKDNKMLIVLSRELSARAVDSFTAKYNLGDIGLVRFIETGNRDSLIYQGWEIKTEGKQYVISKPLRAVKPHVYPAGKAVFTPVPTPENWREVGGNRTTFGFNRFEGEKEFRRENNLVFFNLWGFENAKQVRLAGNFTNWQHAAFPMTRTENGWVVKVKLDPGQYYYKFIIDENHWITDPVNKLTENDGRGNENSVYFVPNQKFVLRNHQDARSVFLSGTFNNWSKNQVPLKKDGENWSIEMYVEEGTYNYQYIVDGRIVKADGSEKQKLAIGKEFLFRIPGLGGATKVMVAGNFNNWDEDELPMKKTADGWELKYILGPGNYQYKFIVDGYWKIDPENPNVLHDVHGNQNSFMVVGANFTFRLKGNADAKEVRVTGDFTDYSPDGVKMTRVGDGWEARVYLAKGKHRYNFVVDGKAVKDPANKAWELDEGKKQRSVIWIDPNQPI